MGYRLPVRTKRVLDKYGVLPPVKKNHGFRGAMDLVLPHPYAKRDLNGTDIPVSKWKDPFVSGSCGCGTQHIVDDDGYEICVSCGWVGGSVNFIAPAWHGTHTLLQKHFYDPSNYMNVRLKKLGKGVPDYHMRTIMKVFPSIYKAFFKCAPNRKNMMDYGFVISRMLELLGDDPSKYNIKTVTTPSKIRDNIKYWEAITKIVTFRFD